MPGGVNSPVRAFKSVGGQPIVIDSVKGSKMTDIDGNEYIDYVGSWGPAIIGHADDKVWCISYLHNVNFHIVYLLNLVHTFFFVCAGSCGIGRNNEERNELWCSMSTGECFGRDGDRCCPKH